MRPSLSLLHHLSDGDRDRGVDQAETRLLSSVLVVCAMGADRVLVVGCADLGVELERDGEGGRCVS